jgi:hypothetical protein
MSGGTRWNENPDAALHQTSPSSARTGAARPTPPRRHRGAVAREGRRVGIVDPTGAWWGLRSSRDGKGAGFPILVLGGDHGDLPLPPNGGAAVARLLAVQNVNLVADTSQLTVASARAGSPTSRDALPAQQVAAASGDRRGAQLRPAGQGAGPDAGKMLHAASRWRARALARHPPHDDYPASAEAAQGHAHVGGYAHRHARPRPLDRGAVADWINGCGDPAKGQEVLNSLASLQRARGGRGIPRAASCTG